VRIVAMISVPESIELETTRKMFENPEVIRISEDYTVILRKSERGKKYAEGILRAKNRRNKESRLLAASWLLFHFLASLR
jgi:hypothetical protein